MLLVNINVLVEKQEGKNKESIVSSCLCYFVIVHDVIYRFIAARHKRIHSYVIEAETSGGHGAEMLNHVAF
jgi:hypothetical protein